MATAVTCWWWYDRQWEILSHGRELHVAALHRPLPPPPQPPFASLGGLRPPSCLISLSAPPYRTACITSVWQRCGEGEVEGCRRGRRRSRHWVGVSARVQGVGELTGTSSSAPVFLLVDPPSNFIQCSLAPSPLPRHTRPSGGTQPSVLWSSSAPV